MSSELKTLLPPLPRVSLLDCLRAHQDEGAWSVGLTATTGQRLLGDLRFRHQFLDKPDNMENVHVPRGWPPSWCGLRLTPFDLEFNSSLGTEHGRAHTLQVPEELIAGISPVRLPDHLARYRFKNIPNPFAEIIAEHNTFLASQLGLQVQDSIELSLPITQVVREGIRFKQPEVIYADWDFLRSIAGFSLSVKLLGVTLRKECDADWLSLGLLTDTLPAKFLKWRKRRSEFFESHFGFLRLPPETTTTLMGEEWRLVVVSDNPHHVNHPGSKAVLLDPRYLRYPAEYLRHVVSPLMVFGEKKQIPIEALNQCWESCILARSIGFVGDAPP